MQSVELLGYAASLFIVMSLFMTEIKKLRYLNLIGCALFTAYGIIISAYPVAVMNGIAVGINLYHLFKLYRRTNTNGKAG